MSELPLNILSQLILITYIELIYLFIYILTGEYMKHTVARSFKLQVALKNYKSIYRRETISPHLRGPPQNALQNSIILQPVSFKIF